MVPLDKRLQWVDVKQTIQTDLGTFRHNQTDPGIIQGYSGIFRTLYYLAYLKLWYIWNPVKLRTKGTFRTLAYSKSEAYSEPCQTSTMKRFAKIVNGYNYFHKL